MRVVHEIVNNALRKTNINIFKCKSSMESSHVLNNKFVCRNNAWYYLLCSFNSLFNQYLLEIQTQKHQFDVKIIQLTCRYQNKKLFANSLKKMKTNLNTWVIIVSVNCKIILYHCYTHITKHERHDGRTKFCIKLTLVHLGGMANYYNYLLCCAFVFLGCTLP